MRIFRTILVGMILAVAIIPLPGHTASAPSPADPAAAEQTAPPAVTPTAPEADTAPATPATPAPAADAPGTPPAAQPPAATPVSDSSLVPVAAPSADAGAKPIEVVQNGELKLKLNFQDAPVQTILEYLSETVGLTIMSDEPISTSRITVISRQPITLGHAIALINSMLKDKGLTAILQGKTLRVIPLSKAPVDSGTPVRIVRDPNLVEPSDSVATYIIPISHITAAGLVQNLQGLLTESAQLTPNAEGNALIITDTAANVRRLMQIVAALDTHMATVTEIRVWRLYNADATSTAALINTIFQQQAQGGRGGFGSRGGFGGSGGVNPFQMMMQMRGGMGGPGGGMGGGPRGQMGGPRGQLDESSGPLGGRLGGGGLGGGIGRGMGDGIGVTMAGAMGGLRGGRGGQQGGSGQQGAGNVNAQVVAAADTQTNSVVVRGPAEALDLVDKVIKALDETVRQGRHGPSLPASLRRCLEHGGCHQSALRPAIFFFPLREPGRSQRRHGRHGWSSYDLPGTLRRTSGRQRQPGWQPLDGRGHGRGR